jgi:hypothetical protein
VNSTIASFSEYPNPATPNGNVFSHEPTPLIADRSSLVALLDQPDADLKALLKMLSALISRPAA